MSLVLLIISSLLLGLLFVHSWYYRGRVITLGFFGLSFMFGVIRGNLIQTVITRVLGGNALPYLFVRPVIHLGNVSLQECVGWTFTIYLSWCLAEQMLSRRPGRGRDTAPVFRLLGLVCLIMGAISYAVEAVATGSQWWIWTIQTKNPYYAAVPWAGIVAWISVGFNFFWPFLLIASGAFSRRTLGYLFVWLFPLYLLSHLNATQISADWFPFLTEELWDWLMICAILAGIVLGGPRIKIPLTEKIPAPGTITGSLVRHAPWVVALGFLLVLGACHLFIVRNQALLISLAPYVTALLFVRPKTSLAFCVAACLSYGLTLGEWTYTVVPSALCAVFAYAAYVPEPDRISRRGRAKLLPIALGVFLVLASIAVNRFYHERNLRYKPLIGLIDRLGAGGNAAGIDSASLASRLVNPPRSKDAVPYNKLGYLLLIQDRYREAAFILEKAAACDSTFACVYFNLALCYQSTGDLEKAAAAYEKGLELNPVDSVSYLLLGRIYEQTNRPEQAAALYRRGLAYRPDNRELAQALKRLHALRN